ncbi:MAG TPA: 3-hydroxyacyl-CoA dehydrogenase NAD-binding domain-containing protein [Motilibacteraceae bacterium]|nr:3-hydroxyacyl-CoA dehydrogenase NAD-binding domain-containing protein [Motilibacteraceae bacterium]
MSTSNGTAGTDSVDLGGIRYERGDDGVVLLTMDLPGASANTMGEPYRAAMDAALERLEADRSLAGVVITSAKKTFFAGADLNEMLQVRPEDAAEMVAGVTRIKRQLRRLETLGVPVAAAINGSALGGGWEIALACHHRVAVDAPGVKVGLPEVTLGLLPGGGGVVRMVRMLGLLEALPLLLEGKQLSPAKAQGMGLVDELAADPADAVAKARAWVATGPDPRNPWDREGWKLPGGTPTSPKVAQALSVAPAMLRKKTWGTLPAPERILAAAVEGAQVDFATAETIETRYFVSLATGQVAKNMVSTFFFQLNEVNGRAARMASADQRATGKVAVLGAGMMGAGIALASARKGIDVVLKDVSLEAAQAGKQRVADGVLAPMVAKGRMSEAERDAVLARIHPTGDDADLAGADLLIEAVFEDRALKDQVTKAAEAVLDEGALLASNTSTLPITGLAAAVQDPARFIGIHFFSPVDKMPLVEVIRGRETSDDAVARALAYVRQIGKTPIVVNDGRGFFTSRVFGTFTNEGIAMLAEGVHPATIETEARKAGMPVGPLAVSDEVSLSLMAHVKAQTEKDLAEEGRSLPDHPANAVIDRFVTELGRPGRAGGGGFYEYPAGQPKRLWPQLVADYHRPDVQIPLEDVRDRLLYVQALDTVRCMEEGVLTDVADANVGSIMGIGFAPWTGGALQFVNSVGVAAFVERARYLADEYGERFTPPALLVEMAERGERFRVGGGQAVREPDPAALVAAR